MRIALQQNTVWLIQFSFVKDMPSETDDRKGAGLCGQERKTVLPHRGCTVYVRGAEGSFAGLTANVPEAVIIGKTKKNKYKIWFGHTLLSQCCCWQRSCCTLRLLWKNPGYK